MLKCKQWLLLIAWSFYCCSVKAQLTPYQSFFQYNWQIINPAAIDKAYIYDEPREFMVTASYRKQWVGVANSPQTYFVSVEHKPSGTKNRFSSGIKYGFQAFRDQADALSHNGFYGNFSYYFPIASSGKFIHIGTTAGFIWQQLNVNPTDFVVPESRGIDGLSSNFFDVNIGIFYRDKRKFYAGISVPQLIALDFNDGFAPAKERQNQKNYNLILGGFIDTEGYSRFGNSTWVVEPSLWIRYTPELFFQSFINNRPVSADANIKFHYNQTIWFGGGYSTNQFLNVEFGIGKELDGGVYGHNSDKITIGASWQLPVGNRFLRLGNSFEIKLAYSWK